MWQVFTSAFDESGIECIKAWCTENEVEAAHWRKEGCQVIQSAESLEDWNERFRECDTVL